MIDGTGKISRSGHLQPSPELPADLSAAATSGRSADVLPDQPLFADGHSGLGLQKSGWMSFVFRTGLAFAASAMLLSASTTQVHAQQVTQAPAVRAAQLGAQSFAVGSPLAPASAKSVVLRSPSEKDLASQLAGFRSTVTSGHTPYLSAFFEPGVGAHITRSANAWNDANPYNSIYTIDKLPKDGMIHLTMPVWVSGHTPDQYDADLYPKYTGAPMPDDVVERKKANAKLYANPDSPKHNVHYIWIRRVGSDTPDQLLMPGLKANNEYVRAVQLAISAKPGETIEVRWSPFVGSDPAHPIVGPDDFVAGRTFQIVIPKDVPVGN